MNDRLPSDVLPGSDYEAWWACEQGHDYPRKVEVENRGIGCGTCNDILDPRNSLGYVHPRLVREWHPIKNDRSPFEVSKANSYRAWWICAKGHEWRTSVSNRTVAGTNCGDCQVPATSRQERLIRAEIADFFGQTPPEQAMGPIPGLGRLGHVDIVIRHRNLIIEFDGSYWHRNNLHRDISKADELRALGWIVIRIREQPLPLLTNHDISVPQGFPVAWTAGKVISKFLDIVHDPNSDPLVASTAPILPLIRFVEPWPRTS